MNGICTNCMEYTDLSRVPVGFSIGNQRDSYRRELLLCGTCADALCNGRLLIFHTRYGTKCEVTRIDIEPTEDRK